ncbi:MAG: class I SAM-dependent methyltransferase [Flavobacteriales bacterium]
MIKRGQLSNILRFFRLIYLTDWIRYYIEKFKNKSNNNLFKANNPNILLPPDYLLYESFQLSYEKYYFGGHDTANWLKDHFKEHITLKDKSILDWGCGPGRVIRHMPEVIGNNCKFYGTDYNSSSISWCKENLKEIEFNLNTLEATLPYEDSSIDVIYGISIFTHLSKDMHYAWYNELFRILKPGGIMFLTTHGNNYKAKLTDNEINDFDQGKLIERGYVKEGHRTYTAFQPPSFMKELFSNLEILKHLEIEPDGGGWLPQDIWIVKK